MKARALALVLVIPVLLALPHQRATQTPAAATTPVIVTASVSPLLDRPPHVSRSFVRHPLAKPTPKRVSRPRVVVAPWEAWAHQPLSIAVANCESGPGPHGAWQARYIGNAHLMDPNGHYGKWQFSPSTATSVGAPGADIARLSEERQDFYGWTLWKRDGWGPWECRRLI